jgi:uncharacterized membrane protein YvbJ
MAYCPNCGANANDSNYCSYCGTKLNSTESKTTTNNVNTEENNTKNEDNTKEENNDTLTKVLGTLIGVSALHNVIRHNHPHDPHDHFGNNHIRRK